MGEKGFRGNVVRAVSAWGKGGGGQDLGPEGFGFNGTDGGREVVGVGLKNACVWEGRDGEGAIACRGAEEGLEGGRKFGEGGLGLGGVGLMDEDVAEACGCDGIAEGGGVEGQ